MTESDNQLFLMLGRLEGKVDQFLSKQREFGDLIDKHHARLALLEEGKYMAKGVLLTVSAILSTIVGFGTALFTHWILK